MRFLGEQLVCREGLLPINSLDLLCGLAPAPKSDVRIPTGQRCSSRADVRELRYLIKALSVPLISGELVLLSVLQRYLGCPRRQSAAGVSTVQQNHPDRHTLPQQWQLLVHPKVFRCFVMLILNSSRCTSRIGLLSSWSNCFNRSLILLISFEAAIRMASALESSWFQYRQDCRHRGCHLAQSRIWAARREFTLFLP